MFSTCSFPKKTGTLEAYPTYFNRLPSVWFLVLEVRIARVCIGWEGAEDEVSLSVFSGNVGRTEKKQPGGTGLRPGCDEFDVLRRRGDYWAAAATGSSSST